MLSIPEIQARIRATLPEGRVVPRHNSKGHFYEVIDGSFTTPPIYPSVTGKLQQLKDESLINFKMNSVIKYVFAHHHEFTDTNIMEHLARAEAEPQLTLEDAGGIGTEIHDHRQNIFDHWIKTGQKPADFVSFIPESHQDIRAISAIRALQKFVEEWEYTPIACELFVYSHKLKVAGTLDDLGMMKNYIREGDRKCQHETIRRADGSVSCLKCDMKYNFVFTLMDIKSSNQLKDHYFYQVALYFEMFRKLTGITPQRCVIVQLSKETGKYKIEDLYRPKKLAQYAGYMLKVDEGTKFIRSLRKDNQKEVISLL